MDFLLGIFLLGKLLLSPETFLRVLNGEVEVRDDLEVLCYQPKLG